MTDVPSRREGRTVPDHVIYDQIVNATFPAESHAVFGTACVLGGSIAGSLAAAVLARFSRRVVVIERDDTGAGDRPGVPHARQLHALLPSGRAIIDRLLPGFTATAIESGAALAMPAQQANFADGLELLAVPDAPVLSATRSLMEDSARALVLAHPNVDMVRGRATGLRYAEGGVAEVRYSGDDGEHTIPADFTVDAMGAASRLPAWLAADGYDPPSSSRVPCGVTYSTAHFQRTGPVEDLPVACTAARYSSGTISVVAATAVEDSQWSIAVSALDGHPPETAEEFRAACATRPEVFRDAASGTLNGGIRTFHKAHNIRRDFTGLRRFPARLAALGDAAASFNPTYGQGISSAALQAAALSEYLEEKPDLTAPATPFFERQAIVTGAAWAMATAEDAARADEVSGAEVPDEVRRQRQAAGQIARAAIRNPDIGHALLAASHMLIHPETLFTPEMIGHATAVNERLG